MVEIEKTAKWCGLSTKRIIFLMLSNEKQKGGKELYMRSLEELENIIFLEKNDEIEYFDDVEFCFYISCKYINKMFYMAMINKKRHEELLNKARLKYKQICKIRKLNNEIIEKYKKRKIEDEKISKDKQ